MLQDFADENSVSRSLEAYLLWLFGYIMFNNSHGNSVDKILIDYAREIADSDPEKTCRCIVGALQFLQPRTMDYVKIA